MHGHQNIKLMLLVHKQALLNTLEQWLVLETEVHDNPLIRKTIIYALRSYRRINTANHPHINPDFIPLR